MEITNGKVYLVRSRDPLDMEGAPDVESIWSTRELADEEAVRLNVAEIISYPNSRHHTEFDVEEWEISD